MPYAVCPACDEDIHLPTRPRMSSILFCPSCEVELQVVSTNPLELDWHIDDEDDDEEEGYVYGDDDESLDDEDDDL